MAGKKPAKDKAQKATPIEKSRADAEAVAAHDAFPWANMVTWHMRAGELVAILRTDTGKGVAGVAFAPAPRDVCRALLESINTVATTGEEGEFVEIGFTEANAWSMRLDEANARISSLMEALRQIRTALDEGRRGDASKIARAMTLGHKAEAPIPEKGSAA